MSVHFSTRVNLSPRRQRRARLLAGLTAFAAVTTVAPVTAQTPVYQASHGPAYQIVRNDPNVLEIRFHGVAIRGVHADDSQNALAIDFQQPVDAAMFDRLMAEAPLWISLSTCNFDNGVIRGTRPVTFLTRAEADGFSLRMVPRVGAPLTQSPMTQSPTPQSPPARSPVAQAAPPPLPPPPPMRGGYTEQRIWPPQEPVPPATAADFHTPGEYAALRAYEAQELAIRRADPMWQLAYGRAAMATDSGLNLRNETDWYHGGDRMIATNLDAKFSFLPGMAFVGDAKWTNVHGVNTRLANGNFANTSGNIVTGAAGFAFELGRDSELKLQALGGNDLIGGGLKFYSGAPDSFGFVNVNYHQPYVATPTAVNFRADTDNATIGYTQMLLPGVWGSLAGHYTRYGVHGDADVARTAGWDASLRWDMPVWDGLLAGISYDGHGEYVTNNDLRTGAVSTPFVPLGIRDMENHAVALNLSGFLGDGFWFAGYAGWVVDRYASNGLLAGIDLHYMPQPGVDLALGIRQSAVSYTQGERGNELSAGLNLTLGMGAPPQPSWMQNAL
jgi:hypothetical protein